VNQLTDRRREEKDRRRNQIVEAAAVVAADCGFDAISMDLVAKQARLSRALVYLYFEDKNALHLALCERALELLQERFALATKDAHTGRDRLTAMGVAYVAFSQELPVYFEALARFQARNAADLQQRGSRCLELGDACDEHLTAAIREGITDGSIRADVGPPNVVSIVLWGFMHGVIQIAATKGALLTHRGTSANELFEQALAMTLRGLSPAP
jgi:TetR/AcrR family transcriptional regulator